MRDKRGDNLKQIYSLFVFNSLGALDVSACLRVANTIQNETFSTGIADYILKNKTISVRNFSLVHQLGENMMGEIIQFGPFCEEDNRLLLSAAGLTPAPKEWAHKTFMNTQLDDLSITLTAQAWIRSSSLVYCVSQARASATMNDAGKQTRS